MVEYILILSEIQTHFSPSSDSLDWNFSQSIILNDRFLGGCVRLAFYLGEKG